MVNHEDRSQNQQQKKMEEKNPNPNPPPEPEKKAEDEKKDAPPPPPPPPQEVVLKVFMHCEGCARKVKRSLKGFPGVEDVIADSKTHKVVVKGEKAAAEPVKVMERVQMKTHRRVELISPIPTPKSEAPEEPKPVEEEKKEKKEEEGPKVITVVLKVHMHCEACSQAIKKRILRMKGVESVETDLKSSQVTVVGVLDPAKLVEYINKRTGKHAAIVNPEPSPDKKEEEAKKEDSKDDEKKQKTDEKPPEAGAEETEKKDDEKVKENGGIDENEKAKLIELKQNEFHYFPAFYAPKFAMDQYYASAHLHPPPPQLFSDENPNACSVM